MTWACDVRHDVREIFLEAQHLNFELARLHWGCRLKEPSKALQVPHSVGLTIGAVTLLLALQDNPRVHYVGKKLAIGSNNVNVIAWRLEHRGLIKVQHVGIKRVRHAYITSTGLGLLRYAKSTGLGLP